MRSPEDCAFAKSSGAHLPLFPDLILLSLPLQLFLCDRKSSCCCSIKCNIAFLFDLAFFRSQENHQALVRCCLFHSLANKSVITGYCIHFKVRSTALISVMAWEMTQMSPVWMQLMVKATHISSSVFYVKQNTRVPFCLHKNLLSAYIRTKLDCTISLYKIPSQSKCTGHLTKLVVLNGMVVMFH